MSTSEIFIMVLLILSSVMFGVTTVTHFDSNYKLGIEAKGVIAACEAPLKRNQNCKLIAVIAEE